MQVHWEDLLEEGMATHASTLTWRIPWTEEPDGPQSRGSQSQTHLTQLSTEEQAEGNESNTVIRDALY